MDSFSVEQTAVFNKYLNGENIFITGPGGSGKSYLINTLRYMLQQMRKKCKYVR